MEFLVFTSFDELIDRPKVVTIFSEIESLSNWQKESQTDSYSYSQSCYLLRGVAAQQTTTRKTSYSRTHSFYLACTTTMFAWPSLDSSPYQMGTKRNYAFLTDELLPIIFGKSGLL